MAWFASIILRVLLDSRVLFLGFLVLEFSLWFEAEKSVVQF